MALILETIPCLSDNYSFLLHDEASGATAVVDVPDAAPILARLESHNWQLDEIWITHHHNDHIGGVNELRKQTGAKVTGAHADIHRLPNLDRSLDDGDSFEFAGELVKVMDVPGHTVGHIAFYLPDNGYLFTGDSLMALGCGRLFEGTPEQMWTSLNKLAELPDNVIVGSGHEYTQANARFALTIDPDNADLRARFEAIDEARKQGKPTVPSNLGEEKRTNPFLRAGTAAVKQAIGKPDVSDIEAFATVRSLKDSF
ncbi:hydroxyacylglutathione hydrolase [Qingshengfaniella alkalisoli]|uniref:Hydroxyacylglutathione hydrolase n=1 Tax=Qingshengfaniella alkalisoli TaxID=2599296 RepID=A0A5B8IQA7_9RHOB|nr:hydroxyacylglutathione hydrolase [Qingshengfaniella alkalisoli]QDY68432.1 hydroxyacylglutathione hydrolase [Qingshengfaniella alkalisoli]